jgi:DNA replication protein DnaC
LRAAKLRQSACVKDIDYRHPRGLDRALVSTLSNGDWIRDHHNLHITGPTGTGKSSSRLRLWPSSLSAGLERAL